MLEFTWLSFGFAVVNFLVLAALLWRVLHKPLLAALEKRERYIETARQKADDETASAEAARKQHEEKLASAGAERDKLLAEARRTSEAAAVKLMADATADARRQAESLARGAERERNDSLAKLQDQVADTVISVAGGVLARVSDADIDKRLEAALLKEIASIGKTLSPNGDRCPIRVTSAKALNDASRKAIASAIAEATGQDPALDFKTDPNLVAGTRIEFDAMAVDASLGDVLARIREGLVAETSADTVAAALSETAKGGHT